MPKIALDIIMYIFEALLFYNYANGLFSGKKSRDFKILLVALIHIILFFIYQLDYAIANGVFLFILYPFAFWYVFNVRISNAIFHALIFISIMVLSEVAVISLCTLLFNDYNAMHSNNGAYIFVIVSSKLIYFTVMMLIKKLFAVRQTTEGTKDKFFSILFLPPLTSIVTVFLFNYISYEYNVSDTGSVFMSIASVLLLFADIIVFAVYERSKKNLDELYELKAIAFQQEIDKKYFDAIEQTNGEIKHFSHDMKNHLTQIRYIDDIQEAHKYLDRLISDVEKISHVVISKNKMLNLIISKYISICDKKGIKFTPSVKLASLCYIDDVDLATLLNNLLDNAVDTAEKEEGSVIEFYVFSKNSRYDGIIIKNTCTNPPKTLGNKLITSKKDKAYHGLGLNIVKKILKKYDAVYDWKYDSENRIFETDLAIPKKTIDKAP